MLRFCLCLCIIFFHANASANSFYYHNDRVEKGMITNPANDDHSIEFFILKPTGQGPFPLMILLHGYQAPNNSLGGKELVDFGYLDRFIDAGIAAVSVSVPGYGNSPGERDFGGPFSQNSILAVINHFKNQTYVDSSHIGIYGISRGAQLAAMVSSHSTDIAIQVLEGGFYDLVTFASNIPEYLELVKYNLEKEGGNSLEALKERSPAYHTDTVKAATLILHGEFDDRKQLPAAQKLHNNLIKHGVDCHLKIFAGEMHCLSAEKWDTIMPFMRERFFDLYGIGIKVTKAFPAMQILKIHPNSPALQNGKLRVGDAILSISPQNDEQEISVLSMPVEQFVTLMLGKKDTLVRLRVQHFDLSTEDVVVKRG